MRLDTSLACEQNQAVQVATIKTCPQRPAYLQYTNTRQADNPILSGSFESYIPKTLNQRRVTQQVTPLAPSLLGVGNCFTLNSVLDEALLEELAVYMDKASCYPDLANLGRKIIAPHGLAEGLTRSFDFDAQGHVDARTMATLSEERARLDAPPLDCLIVAAQHMAGAFAWKNQTVTLNLSLYKTSYQFFNQSLRNGIDWHQDLTATGAKVRFVMTFVISTLPESLAGRCYGQMRFARVEKTHPLCVVSADYERNSGFLFNNLNLTHSLAGIPMSFDTEPFLRGRDRKIAVINAS